MWQLPIAFCSPCSLWHLNRPWKIWKDPKDTNVVVRRVDLANWALQTSPKFTRGLNITTKTWYKTTPNIRRTQCFCSKASIVLFFSFHLYVFTTLTCGPDDADRQYLVSATLSPHPFLFYKTKEGRGKAESQQMQGEQDSGTLTSCVGYFFFNHSVIHPTIQWSIQPFRNPCNHSAIHITIHSSMQQFSHPAIHLVIQSSNQSAIHPTIQSSMQPLIQPFNHPSNPRVANPEHTTCHLRCRSSWLCHSTLTIPSMIARKDKEHDYIAM